MTSYQEQRRRRRKNDIPAYIFVPSQSLDADQENDDSSIGSLSTLEGYKYLEQEEENLTRKGSIQFRTHSLPTTLTAAYRALSLNSRSSGMIRTLAMAKLENSFTDSHLDRPPRVPQRRRSIQTTSSCPLMAVPRQATPARQALAA